MKYYVVLDNFNKIVSAIESETLIEDTHYIEVTKEVYENVKISIGMVNVSDDTTMSMILEERSEV